LGVGEGPGGALASAASAADDVGAPAAVGALSPALKALNDLLHTRAGRRAAGRPALLASYRAGLSYVLDDLPGFNARDPQASLAALRAAALARAGPRRARPKTLRRRTRCGPNWRPRGCS